MRLKVLSLLAAVVLVAACQTAPENTGAAANTGAATTTQAGPTPGSEQDLVQNVGDRVFFAFDKSDLSSEARATLDRQVAWLKKYPQVKVTIEGHTDDRGTREYNLALGERRANAVKKYLIAAGVDAARINTISYGKERPAVVGTGEAVWAQNRRAVTVVQ